MKDAIDPAGGGNLITGNAEEKRSKEELLEVLTENADLPYMYKIVGNSNILKFPVTLKDCFDNESFENEKQEQFKDEVKFGFNLHIESKRSAT